MDFLKLSAYLTLDSSAYELGLNSAEAKTQTFGGKLKSGLGKVAGLTTKAIAAASAAVGGFGAVSIRTGMSFDKSMSQVAATMGMSADEMHDTTTQAGKDFQALRNFAQEMGRTTAFSAIQAADALNYMALAGYDTETSMKMLPNVLNLAAAGNMDLARASDMVTDTQTAFGISLDRTSQMVDEMAKAASTGNTSVEQLGDAFLVVGGLAKELNGGFVTLADGTKAPVDGIQEMEIALTAMANAGVKGSEAGTHMRNMIMKLSSPTKEGVEQMEALGVKVFDADGKMRSLNDIMGDLNGALGNLTQEQKIQAISDLFNARDLASAEALLAAVEEDWNAIGESILNSKDAASKMAETQLDNLAGDITLFKSALEGAQIAISDNLSPSLRDFVKEGSTGLSEFTKKLKSGDISGAIESLGTAIGNIAVEALKHVPSMIAAGGQLLIGIGKGIAQNAPVIIESAGQLVLFLYNGIINNAPKLIDSAVVMINNLGAGLANSIPQFLAQALPVIEQFSGMLRENAGKLVDAGMELILNIAQGIANSIPTLIQYIPQIVINIAGIINDNMPKILTTGIKIITTLANGLVNAIPVIVANIPKILEAIVSVMMAFNWLSLGKNIITFIGNGIKSLSTTLPQTLKSIGQTAIEWLSAINWTTLGADIIDLIVIGIQGLASTIPTLLKTIFTTGVQFIKSINWLEVGTFLIEGIVNGVNGALGLAIDAITGIGKAILDGFKSFFGIASPSTVMEEQGNFLIEGLSNALTALPDAILGFLTEGLNTVISWGADLASKGLEAAQKFASNVKDGFNSAKEKVSETVGNIKEKVGSGFSAAKDKVANAVGNIKDKVGSGFSTAKEKVSNAVKNIKDGAEKGFNNAKTAVIKAVTGIKTGVSTGFTAARATVTTATNAIKSGLSSGFSAAKSSVVSAVNSMKDRIKSGFTAAKSTATNIFNNIKSKIKSAMDSAKNAVSNAVDKIKSKMHFHWSLPRLKLPHFTVSGKFSVNPPSVPHFSVSWHKKAMDDLYMLNKATIFGAMGGKLLGGGEAGREIIVGEQKALDMISKASGNQELLARVNYLIRLLEYYLPKRGINSNELDRMLGALI